jgi:hypothetical protein
MKNSIITIKNNSDSYWITKDKSAPFSESTLPLEKSENIELVNYIVSQFEETSPSLIPIFKERLILWLENIDEATDLTEENEKIRDFIYEMF